MRRRQAIRTVAATAAVGVLAGCVDAAAPSGPRNPPSEADAGERDPTEPDPGPPDFRIGEWDYVESDDGSVVVVATIHNDAPSERSGTFVVEIDLDDESYEERVEVTVPAEDETDVEVDVDVPFDRFDAGGTLRLDLVPA